MFATLMKWVSMAALLLAAMFWRSAADYQLALEFVVCTGASVVVMQAVRAEEYRWAAGFVAMALLFNPVGSVPRSIGALFFLMIFVCLAPFAISLGAWKTQPLLSIPSVTGRNMSVASGTRRARTWNRPAERKEESTWN